MPEESPGRVMQATWDWKSPGGGPSARTPENLRRGAVTQAFVMALVAVFLYFVLQHHLLARIIIALAAVVLILGVAFPPAYRPIHAFGRWLGRVVGKGLTYLLLVPFFFLFFTPVAMILRAQRRDPLHRRYRDPEWTYWIRRSAKERDQNIDRQFLREDKEARGEMRTVGPAVDREGSDRP